MFWQLIHHSNEFSGCPEEKVLEPRLGVIGTRLLPFPSAFSAHESLADSHLEGLEMFFPTHSTLNYLRVKKRYENPYSFCFHWPF